MKRLILLSALCSLLCILTSEAQVPQSMSYQGQLTDAGGNPVPDGPYDLFFTLYDAASGGNTLWTESHSSTSVTNGVFSVALGQSGNLLNLPFDAQYWLGVKVDTEPEMTPRIALRASAYALNAEKVQGTNILPASGSVGIGVTAPGEALDIRDGNVLMLSAGEREIRMIRTDLTDSPTFKLGRIITAGDGSPEFRVLFSDDTTPERAVFEFDEKGIVASVKPPGQPGSHFEGFFAGDVEPLFRLNSSPKMQLELGAGGSAATDVAVRREDTNTLTLRTDDTERVRVDGNGNVGVNTDNPLATLTVDGPFVRRVAVATGVGPEHGEDTGPLSSRVLTFTKLYADTAIRILYKDNFRISGSGTKAVRYEIRVDGADPPGSPIHQTFYNTDSDNYHHPATILGYAFGVPTGAHTIQIYLSPLSGVSQADVYTGFSNSTWIIEAQEVWTQ